MARGWPAARRNEVIDVALGSRSREEDLLRGFRGGPYAFDIVMDIGAYRDLHRHRRCQQFRQAYSGELGYDTPAAICRSRAWASVYDAVMAQTFAAMATLPGRGRRIICCRSGRARASCSRWISPRPNTSRACAAA